MSLRSYLSALLVLSLAMLLIAGAGAKVRDAGPQGVESMISMMHGFKAGPAAVAQDHAATSAHDYVLSGSDANEHGEHGHKSPYECGSACCDMSCHALSVVAFSEVARPQPVTLLLALTALDGAADNRHIRLDRPPKTA